MVDFGLEGSESYKGVLKIAVGRSSEKICGRM